MKKNRKIRAEIPLAKIECPEAVRNELIQAGLDSDSVSYAAPAPLPAIHFFNALELRPDN